MPFWYKSVRGALLGLMLLVTGAAPLFTVSIDNDDDEDTPPITVEFTLAPSRKSVQISAFESSRRAPAGQRELFSKAALSSHHHPTLQPGHDPGSPQLVVPLRT